jgi:hypothetical protein
LAAKPPAPAAAPSKPSPPPSPAAPAQKAPVVPAAPPAPAKPAAPAPAKKILEVTLSGTGFTFSITRAGAYDMGRSKDAPLRVDHPTVSRSQSRVTLSDDTTRLTIEDLGGANGTVVNGVVIEGPRPLVAGDTITLGEVTLLVTVREG